MPNNKTVSYIVLFKITIHTNIFFNKKYITKKTLTKVKECVLSVTTKLLLYIYNRLPTYQKQSIHEHAQNYYPLTVIGNYIL